MEQRNEPTTAEIVATLAHIIDQFSEAYLFGDLSAQAAEAVDTFVQARDRLVQLERENAELIRWRDESARKATDSIVALEHQVSYLTARAEKAEAERDAADNGSYDLHKRFESISDEVRKESPSCKLCGNFPERCAFCLKYNAFELRGLRGKGNDGKS